MNFFFFLTIIAAFYAQDFTKIIWLGLVGGLMADLVLGNWLGLSSLMILTACLLIYLYRHKFSSLHLLFQLIFMSLSDIFFMLILGHTWSWQKLIPLLIVTLLIFPLAHKIKGTRGELELEL